MGVLPAQHIRRLSTHGWVSATGQTCKLIDPFTERGEFEGKTYGLGPCTYDFRLAQTLVLPAGGAMVLASTLERVHLPNDVCAHVLDKSSWARKGVSAFNTFFDPGFQGYPTLELVNHGAETLIIPAGIAIVQFKFEFLVEPTEMPYIGKYLNQPPRPVPAKDGDGPWAPRSNS